MIANVADTLRVDTALIDQMRANPDYAYAIGEERPSLLGMLYEGFWRLLMKTVDVAYGLTGQQLLVISILVALALLYWLMAHSRLRWLFRAGGKGQATADEAEQDIYHVDFEQAIGRSLSAKDYAAACRLVYLQTLRELDEAGRIAWNPSKTPTQYTDELALPAFAQLTRHFLRVRYGNYGATAETYDDMRQWQADVRKGGRR